MALNWRALVRKRVDVQIVVAASMIKLAAVFAQVFEQVAAFHIQCVLKSLYGVPNATVT